MIKKFCICLVITAAMPVWSQVEPSASGGGYTLDDTHMMTPPPVSADAYPVIVGSEAKSNYLSGGLVVTGSYMDNLLLVSSQKPIADETYSFLPTISIERRTARDGETLNYSTGFDLYQHTSQLNGVSQNGNGSYRYHFSPYATFVVQDTFRQNSNLYNQTNPFAGGGVSGAPGSSTATIIAPFENQLENRSSAGLEYQYARNAMIGGNVSYAFSHYENINQLQGLDDSNATGASAFLARRLSRSQYAGAVYQYSKDDTKPIKSYTVNNTVFGFYTIYLTQAFSLSILGGPEHTTTWTPTSPKVGSWTPAVQGSFGWQTFRSSVSASFSHIVSGAGGLIGTYHANTASLSGRLLITRRWSAGVGGNYSLFKQISTDPLISVYSYGGGHSIQGTGYLERRLTEKITAEVGYAHFHQSYPNVPAASYNPDSNRVFGSVAYRFNRPLGR